MTFGTVLSVSKAFAGCILDSEHWDTFSFRDFFIASSVNLYSVFLTTDYIQYVALNIVVEALYEQLLKDII